jgi:hypothetical protein
MVVKVSFKTFFLSKVAFKLTTLIWSGVGGLWVGLGKIKCAAKALASVLACSFFNFAKFWYFVCHFSDRLLSVVSVV